MPAWDYVFRAITAVAILTILSIGFYQLWDNSIPMEGYFKVSAFLENHQDPKGHIYYSEQAISVFSTEQNQADYYWRLIPENFSQSAAIIVERNGIAIADFLLGEVTIPSQNRDRITIYNRLNKTITVQVEKWTERGRVNKGQLSIKAGQRAEIFTE